MTSRFVHRHKLKTAIRTFFEGQGFLEVDTPILVPTPGAEVHLQYFASEYQTFSGNSRTLFLRSSPELHLKRVMSEGHSKIFELAPSFRNHGEHSDWHNPEFTMLEWYETSQTLDDLIHRVKQFIAAINSGWEKDQIQSEDIKCWSVAEAFEKFADLDPFSQGFVESAIAAKLTNIKTDDSHETVFFKIMLDVIEPQLKQYPVVFLHGYPPSTAALASITEGVANRIEIYLDGVEAGNGFLELTSRQANESRLNEISHARNNLNYHDVPIDDKFLEATEQLPPCTGMAIGFDRLLAWLLGQKNIRSVLPYGDVFDD